MTALALEDVEVKYIDGRDWLVEREIRYITAAGRLVVVPANTRTDFASIPRFLWPVLPPVGDGPKKRYGPGAILHDELYRTGRWADGTPCTRAEADAVLLEAMVALEVETWARRTIYAGVRVGGWVTWNRYRAAAPSADARVRPV